MMGNADSIICDPLCYLAPGGICPPLEREGGGGFGEIDMSTPKKENDFMQSKEV